VDLFFGAESCSVCILLGFVPAQENAFSIVPNLSLPFACLSAERNPSAA
jgi:hypothetical protein